MAKGFNRQQLIALARAGAVARIAELEAQIEAIRRTVGLAGAVRRGRKPGRPAGPAPRVRRRGKMSKEGRAKIAAAAKRRWAKWRKEKGK